MNRRRFLKRAGIWVPSAIAFPAIVRSQLSDPAFVSSLTQPAVAAAACSGTPYITLAGTNAYDAGSNSLNHYVGVRDLTDASARNICRVDWKLTSTGTITGLTYVARIWDLNVADLNNLLGSSSGVTGGTWSATWVQFDFASPVAIAGSTAFTITIDCGSTDGTNHIQVLYGTASGFSFDKWAAAKTNQGHNANLTLGCMVYST